MKSGASLPVPVRRALRKLGRDIRNARLRRRITAELVAERASMSRMTLYKVERGDPGVAIGNYATVLFVLGLHLPLADVADLRSDGTGLALEEEALPKRVRHSQARPAPGAPGGKA